MANTVSCKCLNIRFPISSLKSDDCSGSEGIQDDNAKCYLKDIAIRSLLVSPRPIQSNAAVQVGYGALTQFPCLIDSKFVDDQWQVFNCHNCKTLTHAASQKQSDLVLVNVGEMLMQSQQKVLVDTSPHYCDLFGIVTTSMQSFESMPPKPTLKPSVMGHVRDIQERTADYLESKKDEMRAKVAEFEREEHAKYRALEDRVLTSKKSLEAQIWTMFDNSGDDVDSAFEKSIEEIASDKPGKAKSDVNHQSSSATDDMFEFDPLSYDDENAPAADDDDLFEEEDAAVLPNYMSRASVSHDQVAKSVPVPICRPQRTSVTMAPGSFSDDDITPGPQDMRASIRALAQSVGGDGTEMFGDLPRPRFNTSTRRH